MKLLRGTLPGLLPSRQVRPGTPYDPDETLKCTVDRSRITRFRFHGVFHGETQIHSKGATK